MDSSSGMEETHLELELPGFRFHPTEEELLDFYLKKMIMGKSSRFDIIGYLNIYLYDPWVLPGLSKIGEREWYFYVPRDRKHGSGGRPNRTTQNGFWKATGSDRKIFSLSDPKKHLGLKKTLVFYKGRAPRGSKTDWVMNEYRLPDSCPLPKEIVLCKIYRKATSMKVLEQRAMEEGIKNIQSHSPPSSDEIISFDTQNDYLTLPQSQPSSTPMTSYHVASVNDDELYQDLFLMTEEKMKEEPDEISDANSNNNDRVGKASSLKLPTGDEMLSELQLPKISDANSNNNDRVGKASNLKLPTGDEMLSELQLPKMNTDWTQDSFWTQLRSPWLDNLMLSSPYANILNF